MRSTCGSRRSMSVARPSAAPHIACRSSLAAAAPRSPPAFLISWSALPGMTTASTTPPGHGVGDGPTASSLAPGDAAALPEAEASAVAGTDSDPDGGATAGDGEDDPAAAPHA